MQRREVGPAVNSPRDDGRSASKRRNPFRVTDGFPTPKGVFGITSAAVWERTVGAGLRPTLRAPPPGPSLRADEGYPTDTVTAPVKMTLLDEFTAENECAGIFLLTDGSGEFATKKQRVGEKLEVAPGAHVFKGKICEASGDTGRAAIPDRRWLGLDTRRREQSLEPHDHRTFELLLPLRRPVHARLRVHFDLINRNTRLPQRVLDTPCLER